jgi:hypothetical protein
MSVSGESSATAAFATAGGAVVIAGSRELAIVDVLFETVASTVVVFGFSVDDIPVGSDVLEGEAVFDAAFASLIGALGLSLAGATAAGAKTGTISAGFAFAVSGAAFTFAEAAGALGSPIIRDSLAANVGLSPRSFLYVSFDWLVRSST